MSSLDSQHLDWNYDIRHFGAIGDGRTLCTKPVQQALDTASKNGGGRVLVPPGRFLIGTIYLRDNIDLHLLPGAVLLGSTNIQDYGSDTHKNMYDGEPHMDRCLIFARSVRNISITGSGTIDGQGTFDNFPNSNDPHKYRPMLIRVIESSKITIKDVSLINPAAWTSAWLYCDHITVDGIRISSRVNDNGDGLDFDGCTDVRVSNSSFDNSDDSICLQTSRPDKPCENIVVTNCIFSTKWAGMRIGLLSRGNFSNVAVSNCIFQNITDSGLKIQMCEGAQMRNMVFSNLVMHNVPRPVFMTFNRQQAGVDSPNPVPPMNYMSDFLFDTIRIDSDGSHGGVDSAFIFTGVPGKRIGRVSLSHISFTSPGGYQHRSDWNCCHSALGAEPSKDGGELTLSQLEVPELAEFSGPDVADGSATFSDGRSIPMPRWPEYQRFGVSVPASGIYARHLDELIVTNCMFSVNQYDDRPVIVCDDVGNTIISQVYARTPLTSKAIKKGTT